MKVKVYADNYNSNSAAEEISNEDDYFADYESNNNSLTSIAFETESDEKPIEMTTSAPFEKEEPIEKAPVKVSTKDVDPKDIVTYVGEDGKVHKKIVRKVKKKVPSKQTEIKAADTKEVEPKTEVKKVSIKDVDPKDIVTYIGEDGKVHKKIVRKVKKSAATAGAVPVNKDKTTADNETVATKEVSYVDENGVVRKKIIKTVKRNVPKTSTSNSLLKSSNEILEPVTDTKEIAKEEKSIVAKPSTTEAVKKSDGEVITYMGEDGKLHKKIVRKVKKPVVKDAANKVVEKSSEKPIEKAVETTIDKPVTKSVKKPVEKTVVKPTKESTEKSLVQSVNKTKTIPDEKPLMNKLGIDTDIPVSKPKGIIKETGTGNFKNTEPVKRENIEFDSPLPGEPFELPLPGPKKHTKKYLDFDHETDDNADYSFTIEI